MAISTQAADQKILSERVTPMDIRKLVQDPSPVVRSELAVKIAANVNDQHFGRKETDIAFDILRILARDIEMQVRRALSDAIADSDIIPHDIILKIAYDISDVAAPVLERSQVLTEEDLLEIIRSSEETSKLTSIARRVVVSEKVSSSLIASGHDRTLQVLFKNKGARIGEVELMTMWPVLEQKPALLESLVQHGGLPVTIAEKLYTVVSSELKNHLTHTYSLPYPVVHHQVDGAREWATLAMVAPDESGKPMSDAAIESLVHQLYTGGRLTYSLLIRSLAIGDTRFFESALARMGGVPRENVHILMSDDGPLGFSALYRKAHMPEGYYGAIRLLLRLSMEDMQQAGKNHEAIRRHLIERVKAHGYDRSVENMDHLLSVLGEK